MSTDTRDTHITIGDIGPLDTVTTQADGMRERRRAAIGLVYTALETAKKQDDTKAKKILAFEALAKRKAGKDGQTEVEDDSTEMDSGDDTRAATTKKHVGKEPYGDVPYADVGYQPDGKKRYPVDTEAHIRAAWNYFSKPSDSDKYTPAQRAKIRAKIISRWKAVIDPKGPPSA